MSTTAIIILVCFFACNLLGIGIYHYTWKHAVPYKDWKCADFILNTIWMLFCGTAYCIIRLIDWIIKKCKKA